MVEGDYIEKHSDPQTIIFSALCELSPSAQKGLPAVANQYQPTRTSCCTEPFIITRILHYAFKQGYQVCTYYN